MGMATSRSVGPIAAVGAFPFTVEIVCVEDFRRPFGLARHRSIRPLVSATKRPWRMSVPAAAWGRPTFTGHTRLAQHRIGSDHSSWSVT